MEHEIDLPPEVGDSLCSVRYSLQRFVYFFLVVIPNTIDEIAARHANCTCCFSADGVRIPWVMNDPIPLFRETVERFDELVAVLD
jgi:hypothetical protein